MLLLTATLGAPTAQSRREEYELSLQRCTLGVTAPGGVVIRLAQKTKPAAGVRHRGGNTPAARYAAKLLATGRSTAKLLATGRSIGNAPGVIINSLFEDVIDGLAATLSTTKLDEVLEDEDEALLGIEGAGSNTQLRGIPAECFPDLRRPVGCLYRL